MDEFKTDTIANVKKVFKSLLLAYGELKGFGYEHEDPNTVNVMVNKDTLEVTFIVMGLAMQTRSVDTVGFNNANLFQMMIGALLTLSPLVSDDSFYNFMMDFHDNWREESKEVRVFTKVTGTEQSLGVNAFPEKSIPKIYFAQKRANPFKANAGWAFTAIEKVFDLLMERGTCDSGQACRVSKLLSGTEVKAGLEEIARTI